MQLGYYEFAGYGDLFLLGAIGLILVVRNWWDIIRYGIEHAAESARLRRRGKPLIHGSRGRRHA